jgi:hypothetical protein
MTKKAVRVKRSHRLIKHLHPDMSIAFGQFLLGLNLFALPGLIFLLSATLSGTVSQLFVHPIGALVLAVTCLAAIIDIFTALVLLGLRYPVKGSVQRIAVLSLVGLGLIWVTAQLISTGV